MPGRFQTKVERRDSKCAIVAPMSSDNRRERRNHVVPRRVADPKATTLAGSAAEAPTPAELCERLALHVSAPSDRTAFLRAARALLAIKS